MTGRLAAWARRPRSLRNRLGWAIGVPVAMAAAVAVGYSGHVALQAAGLAPGSLLAPNVAPGPTDAEWEAQKAAERVAFLIHRHDCWTGDNQPADTIGEYPGATVVTLRPGEDARAIRHPAVVGLALDHALGVNRIPGMTVHGFCRP